MYRFLLISLALVCSWGARAETVLIIPFFNSGGSNNLDWVGEGVAEDIRETLGRQNVPVFGRDNREEVYRRLSIRPHAHLTKASVVKLGEAVDAGRIIYGEFRLLPHADQNAQSKGTLQVKCYLLNLRAMRREKEFTASGAVENLRSVFSTISLQALSALADPAKLQAEEQFRRRRKAIRLDAFENYLRGLLATTTEQQHRYFTQAARLEPEYSQPCYELGRLHWKAKNYRVAAGWLAKVRSSDPEYYRATFLLGLCRFHGGDYENAEASFQIVARVLAMNEVWNNLGAAQSRRNRTEALDSLQKAVDGDTSDPCYLFNLGYVLWKQEDFEEAADEFRAVLEEDPDDAEAKTMLTRCEKKEGPRPAETRMELRERLKENFDELVWPQVNVGRPAVEAEPAVK